MKEVNPEARRRGTYFDFALVYPDLRQGPRCQTRDVGTTIASQRVSQEGGQCLRLGLSFVSPRDRMTARLFTIVNSSLEITLTWRSLLPREEWTGWTTAGEDSGTAGTGLEAEGEITAVTAEGSVEAVVEAETSGL